MIPYVQIPDWTIVAADAFGKGRPSEPIAVHPFGALVALAVLLGGWLSVRQARRLRHPVEGVVDFLYWIAIGGFVGGHVLDVVLYHPELVVGDPLLLLNIGSGQSSFGGFIGATAGAWLWRLVRRRPLGPTAEIIASSFPAAWVVGRLGCTVAHDHPGLRSDLWFAVAYPGGARLDLGLLEAVGVLPLALAALWLRRKPRPSGFFVGLMCTYYAPIRFILDFFRARDLASSDVRYGGLTPAQWATIFLFGVGLYFSARARRSSRGLSAVTQATDVAGAAEFGEQGEEPQPLHEGLGAKRGNSTPVT